MNPRSEPLLWLQLIGLGALPLEALMLLLLLAGNDPGPLPALERLFTWALGALLPAVLLFRRPADPFSLLLVMTPVRARRELQRRLAALQQALPLQVALGLGVAASLPLLFWCDAHAAQAAAFSPLDGSPRIAALLLAALLLALMLWQWQQVIQAAWLLTRPAAALDAVTPLSTAELEERRLCLGLPLLLLDPLQPVPAPQTPQGAAAPSPEPRPEPVRPSPAVAVDQPALAPEPAREAAQEASPASEPEAQSPVEAALELEPEPAATHPADLAGDAGSGPTEPANAEPADAAPGASSDSESLPGGASTDDPTSGAVAREPVEPADPEGSGEPG